MHRLYTFWHILYMICALVPCCVVAQTPRAKGLVFNAPQYHRAVKLRDLEVRGIRELPLRVSLRPFCPTPQDQGAEPSCTAWAIAYGALTVQQAIRRKASNPVDVDKIACSKSFVFNQTAGNDARNIPTIEATFTLLKARGVCLAATFRNDLPVEAKPDELAVEEAKSRRVLSVTEVYDLDMTIALRRQIQRLKRLLADSLPIVVGMRVPYSFSNLTTRTFRYDPAEPVDSSAHALCLVGYDDIDSTFECMNSWGTAWGGDGGFVRFHYRDFFSLLCCAYRLTPQFMVEKRAAASKGAVVLRRSTGYNAARTAQFEEIRVRYDTVQKHYQSVEPTWPLDMGFQITLREMPNGWWVYIFNADEQGVVTLLHQAQVWDNAIEKAIPGEDSKFEIEEPGVEWLGVLCAKEPLPDFQMPLQTYLQAHSGSIHTKTNVYFKDTLPEPPVFTTYRMGFSFPKNATGKATLLMLKMNTTK